MFNVLDGVSSATARYIATSFQQTRFVRTCNPPRASAAACKHVHSKNNMVRLRGQVDALLRPHAQYNATKPCRNEERMNGKQQRCRRSIITSAPNCCCSTAILPAALSICAVSVWLRSALFVFHKQESAAASTQGQCATVSASTLCVHAPTQYRDANAERSCCPYMSS